MTDSVKHPDHYKLMIDGEEVESIDFIKAILGEKGFKKFCRGNALKYLIRADKKGGAEDLKKARVYINWEINDDCEEEQPELGKPHNELEAAFNVIKGNCKGYGNCDGCRFCEHGDCMLLANEPNNWILPEGTNEKNTGSHAEKPMKKINLNPVAEAKEIKDYCSGVNCFDCVFDSNEGCVLNNVDYIPAEWKLPEEKEEMERE